VVQIYPLNKICPTIWATCAEARDAGGRGHGRGRATCAEARDAGARGQAAEVSLRGERRVTSRWAREVWAPGGEVVAHVPRFTVFFVACGGCSGPGLGRAPWADRANVKRNQLAQAQNRNIEIQNTPCRGVKIKQIHLHEFRLSAKFDFPTNIPETQLQTELKPFFFERKA